MILTPSEPVRPELWLALLAEFEQERDGWTDAEVHQIILEYIPEIDAAIRADEAEAMGFGA